jgi:hypothetical protein
MVPDTGISNISLLKNVRISDQLRIQFRTEAFNHTLSRRQQELAGFQAQSSESRAAPI